MNNETRRKYVYFMTVFCAVMAILKLLWLEDFVNFWTIAIGLAYFLLDRWYKETEE